MDPESDKILDNIKPIPQISGFEPGSFTALPYKLQDGTPQFYLSKSALPSRLTLIKLLATD